MAAQAVIPELIFCADGNERFADLAIKAGFVYGAKLPATVYRTPEFADQDWNKPNRKRYVATRPERRPRLATVLDWERPEQLTEVLGWAEEVAQYVTEAVLIIPKVVGQVGRLPKEIGGKSVRLAYSVPSSYGGTRCHPVEFRGYGGIHLLGGCPMKQKRLARKFAVLDIEVVSLDGNYAHKMATKYNQYLIPDGSANFAKNRFWPTLREANNGKRWTDASGSEEDAIYEAFDRSYRNIWRMWHGLPPICHFQLTERMVL